MLDVIGFGAINLDMIYEVESLADTAYDGIEVEPGRECWVSSEVFSRVLRRVDQHGILKATSAGGSAANTVVALSRMGFRTGFVGKVGKDAEGERLLAEMEGVDLEGVVSQGLSGRSLCILDANQDRSIFVETNTNDTLSSEEIDFPYATAARYLHLTSFAGERPFFAQMALVARVASSPRISVDPGEIYACRGLTYLEGLLRRSYVVFVTESEIEMLTGVNCVEGSKRLLELGPSVVACKRGERGVHVMSHDQVFHVPGEPVDIIDNTGAGDVFNAGFLAGLLMNRPLLDCASFGAWLAARSLTGYGRSRYPEREDLEYFNVTCRHPKAK
jgi:ribokinase